MSGNFIPFAIPEIGEEEIREVIDTLKSGWLATGPKTQKFEEAFRKYAGSEYALAVNSCTSGLHLALEAIGIKRGDKVVVPVMTFTATAEVVRYFDADPVFCDVNRSDYNINPESLKELIRRDSSVKAVIVVHLGGEMCDMRAITQICRDHNLPLIEDAAHALPSAFEGKMAGTWGDIGVFSFYVTKTLCTGEGGMIVTNNRIYAERMKLMRFHGIDRDAWDRNVSDKPKWYYSVNEAGFKYNMTDIAASLGLHQLAKLEDFHKRRKKIAERYTEELRGLPGLKLPVHTGLGSYYLYMIEVENRDWFIEKMSEAGIGTSVHFIPLHLHKYWKEKYGLKECDFPVATEIYRKVVSLPIYSKMTDDDVNRVITTVRNILKSSP